jgi:hypothetical protein
MPELRTPVMTRVEASWEDSSGNLQTVTACMEDKSAGGAAIRVNTPIAVGTKLRIKWRFDQFSGTAKYCRSEGKDYVVGIQRDGTKSSTHGSIDLPAQKVVAKQPVVLRVKPQVLPRQQQSRPKETSPVEGTVESSPAVHAALAAPQPRPESRYRRSVIASLPLPQPQKLDAPRRTELAEPPPAKKLAGKERKLMGRKWLELAPWHTKQGAPSANGNRDDEAIGDKRSNGEIEKESRMSNLTQSNEKAPTHSAREVPNFQVELLTMEDIYRAAGIMNPRRGYSINKVVEMLHSEHVVGLAKEMKRASILMALDAAGISLEQVQQDAKVRQGALDAYEAGQQKQIEAVWARKAEEVTLIQAELESVKAHQLARISRNLEGVAREKAAFNAWVALKQQECQSMSEAVELCMKSPEREPVVAPQPEVSEKASAAAAAGRKPI